MRRSLMYGLAAVLLTWAVALAQPAPPAAQAAPQVGPTLAPGIVLGAELSKGIDAKKAKVGQEVVAKSLADLRDNNGNLVIARGAKLVGHVTEVKAATKQEPQSTLGVIFDKVEAKYGKESKEIGMHATIQALAKPQPSAMADQSSGPMEGPGEPREAAPWAGLSPAWDPAGAGTWVARLPDRPGTWEAATWVDPSASRGQGEARPSTPTPTARWAFPI